jgi:hypothetical protein
LSWASDGALGRVRSADRIGGPEDPFTGAPASYRIECPACQEHLATTWPQHIQVDAPTVPDLLEDGWGYASWHESRGARVAFEPGFVNAKRRYHLLGADYPWYVRGRSPERRSPNARLPAIVTCRCGQDVVLMGPSEDEQFFATETREQIQERANEIERLRGEEERGRWKVRGRLDERPANR